jgi:hypothetical protein
MDIWKQFLHRVFVSRQISSLVPRPRLIAMGINQLVITAQSQAPKRGTPITRAHIQKTAIKAYSFII